MKTPEFLGPYRIGDTLGKGGMGSVYHGVHEKSGDEVAVKLIATQVSDEMKFRRRFHSEIETLKRLKHPNIVRLIGYGEEQGMLFYSMEYVPGETLQELIRREKKTPWSKALDIAIQICAALKHAHDMGVIHRDLKPANLILQEDGTVKLVDFGISKIFGYDQTAAGSVMGTADYMAPEQATDAGISARTDLYSLGCVMYAMLVGRPPFRGKNITEVIEALKYKDAVALDLIDPEMPDDIVELVHQLLSKLPEDRPPTSLAVMNRLKAMRAGLLRMQTMTGDEPSSETRQGAVGQDAKSSTGNVTGNAKGSVEDDAHSDTASNSAGRKLGSKTRSAEKAANKSTAERSDDKRSSDTSTEGSPDHLQQTQASEADPKARTVHTEGRNLRRETVMGTGLTRHPAQESSHDTSVGESGQTHFQTVTDGAVREGFLDEHVDAGESLVTKWITVAVLVAGLIAGGAFLVNSLREPSAEDLLATIESYYQQGKTFEAHKIADEFLLSFPDHPSAVDVHNRQLRDEVDRAVKRLRLKEKLRTSKTPLHEKEFLEAMDLREKSPAKAVDKLAAWSAVFTDETMSPDDERLDLARLAEFESDRLRALPESESYRTDSQLAEMMARLEKASNLESESRRNALKGIIVISEGEPWAAEVQQKAQQLLDEGSSASLPSD